MKVAIISDVHGNIFALKEVLKDIEERKVHCIINLGDFIGYGSFPNEVVELIRQNKIMSIKGNYDQSVIENKFSYIRDTDTNKFSLPYAVNALSYDNKKFISNLPCEIVLKFEDKTIKFVHGSPRAINEYLKENSLELNRVVDEMKEDILVCAHTHIPYIKRIKDKIIINDGSVGKPKIGRPNCTYVVLNIEKNKEVHPQIIELEYEYTKIVEDMKEKQFPPKLIDSYKTGKE